MTEIVLLAIIVLLCGLLGWKEREAWIERAKFINALLAKNAQEMVNLELAGKTQIKTEIPKPSEFVPPESLSQKDWEEAIKQ